MVVDKMNRPLRLPQRPNEIQLPPAMPQLLRQPDQQPLPAHRRVDPPPAQQQPHIMRISLPRPRPANRYMIHIPRHPQSSPAPHSPPHLPQHIAPAFAAAPSTHSPHSQSPPPPPRHSPAPRNRNSSPPTTQSRMCRTASENKTPPPPDRALTTPC